MKETLPLLVGEPPKGRMKPDFLELGEGRLCVIPHLLESCWSGSLDPNCHEGKTSASSEKHTFTAPHGFVVQCSNGVRWFLTSEDYFGRISCTVLGLPLFQPAGERCSESFSAKAANLSTRERVFTGCTLAVTRWQRLLQHELPGGGAHRCSRRLVESH